jgi:hypothetical protein
MPSDPRDYKVELSSQKGSEEPSEFKGRPYLSIHFACCGVYSRVYRNREGTAYAGRCPRCTRSVRFAVGDGGTNQRSFVVE